MIDSMYQCSYSITHAENGYVGAYEVMNEVGAVLEKWIGQTAFPTQGLALACAKTHAEAAVRMIAASTIGSGSD